MDFCAVRKDEGKSGGGKWYFDSSVVNQTETIISLFHERIFPDYFKRGFIVILAPDPLNLSRFPVFGCTRGWARTLWCPTSSHPKPRLFSIILCKHAASNYLCFLPRTYSARLLAQYFYNRNLFWGWDSQKGDNSPISHGYKSTGARKGPGPLRQLHARNPPQDHQACRRAQGGGFPQGPEARISGNKKLNQKNSFPPHLS